MSSVISEMFLRKRLYKNTTCEALGTSVCRIKRFKRHMPIWKICWNNEDLQSKFFLGGSSRMCIKNTDPVLSEFDNDGKTSMPSVTLTD